MMITFDASADASGAFSSPSPSFTTSRRPQQLLEPLAVTAASSRGPSSLLPAGCSARVCLCTVNLAVLLTEVSGLKVMIFYY
jgi:hypothetical protein